MPGGAMGRLAFATALLLGTGCSLGDVAEPVLEITFSSPALGARYAAGDTIPIVVIPDDPRVERMTVWFWADGRLLAIDSVPPWEARWATTDRSPLRPRIWAQAFNLPRGTTTRSVDVELTWSYRRPPEMGDGWSTTTLGDVGLDPAPLDSLVKELRSRSGHLVDGIVIVRHGKLVFEKYFDGLSHPTFGERPISYGPRVVHGLSSVTKSFTSTLLGLAIQERCVGSTSDRVFAYFPNLSDLDTGSKGRITLRDLVTMSSGLVWDEQTYAFNDARNDLIAWLGKAATTSTDPARDILSRGMAAEPGARFNYAGADFNILGNAVQRGCGQRLDRFAQASLFDPLEVGDAWWWVFPSEFVYASGDLALTPREMAKLGQLFLQDGVWNGKRILPQGWVATSTAAVHSLDTYRGSDGIDGYAYGWWTLTDEYGAGAYEAWGWGGQYIVVMPVHDMVVALTGGSYWTSPWRNGHRIMTEFVLPATRPPRP